MFVAALKACAVARTVNAGFPSIVTQIWNENEVGNVRNPGSLKAMWRNREWNFMAALLLDTQETP